MVLQMPYTGFGVEAEDTTATESQTSESEYTEVTFSSYGIDNATYTGTSKSGSLKNLTSMDKVAFSGKIKFSGNETSANTYVRIGGNASNRTGYALGIVYNNNVVNLINHLDGGTSVLKTVAPSKLTKNPLEESVEIRLTFDYENTTDMRVKFSIEGTEYYNGVISNGIAKIGTYLSVKSTTNPLTVTSTDWMADYTTLTFTDLGYPETKTVTNTEMSKSIADGTLHHVAIEGYYNFTKTATQSWVFIGGAKQGIRLASTASGNMYVHYYNPSSQATELGAIYATNAGTLTETDVKIKVGFAFSSVDEETNTGNVKIIILISDTYQKEYDLTNVSLASFKKTVRIVSGATTAPLTITSIKKVPMLGYKVLTFTDFGFEEVASVSTSTQSEMIKSIEGKTLDKVAVEGYYNFAKTTAHFVYIGGDAQGIKLETTASGNMYVKHRTAAGSETTKDTLYANTLGIALTGEDVKFKIGFEFLNVNSKGTIGDVKVTMVIADSIERGFTIEQAELASFNQTIKIKSGSQLPLTIKAILGTPEAMVNENHVKITQADFAFNGTQGAVKRSDISGELGKVRSALTKGLAGTKLNMDILFPTSSDAKFCYGASSEAEDGLTIYSDGNGNLILKDNINDLSYTIEAQKAGTTLVGKRFNLQISHVPNGTGGVLLGIWINGQLYNNGYMELPTLARLGSCIATTGTDAASVTMWMPLESQNPNMELEQITIDDFKILDNEKTTVEKTYSGTLLNKVFSAKLRLWSLASESNHGNLIHYGGTQSGWVGFIFKVWSPDRMSLIYKYRNESGTLIEQTIDANITSTKAGTTFTGHDIVMSISLEEADFDKDGTLDDIKLGVFFNGQLYNNRYYFVSLADGEDITDKIKSYLGLHSSNAGNGNIRYYSVADWRKAINLETMPVDYGIADGTYTEATSGSLGSVTMSGKLLSANVKFADGGKVVAGGTDANNGFQIAREGEKLYLSSVSGSLAKTELDWTRAVLNLDREMNLKLSLKAVENDAYLFVWINDAFIGSYSVEGMTVGSYVQVSNMTITSEKRSISENYDDYTKYTFGDCGEFGLGYQTHTEDVAGTITDMATNEVIIRDKLLIKDDATVTVSGYTFAMNEGMLTLSAGDVAIMTTEVGSKAFTFALDQKIVDADGDGSRDDICLTAFVNDDNRQYYLLDKTIDANISISANGGSVTVQNELPAWPVNIEDVTTGYTLATDKDSIGVNGQATEAGTDLTAVGDYHIVYNTSEGKVQQAVAIYKDGDVNADSAVNVKDLVALKKAQQGILELTNAGIHAADFNDDGGVDTDDTLLRTGLVTSINEVKKENKQTVFGVISDMHYIDDFNGHREVNFRRALEKYRENGAEVIIMNGDVSDHGTAKSYANLLETIQEVFPDIDQAPKMISVADAHEYYSAWEWVTSSKETEKDAQNRFLTSFANNLGQTGLNSNVEVGGYHFISLSADSTNPSSSNDELGTGQSWFSDETVQDLEDALADAAQQAAEEGEPNRAIFVAIHQPPADTIAGKENMTQLKDVLRKYPQVVLFTSHTHISIKRENSIYQEYSEETKLGYTVVNTASLYYLTDLTYVNRHKAVSSVFENAYEFGEGLLVRVNGDKVRIERHDFYNDEKIKEDWVVTTSADGSTLTDYTTARKDTRQAPVFAEGTELHVLQTSDTSVKLIFDAASHEEDFVHYYYVEVLDANGNTVTALTGNYSNNFHLGLDRLPKVQEIVLKGLNAGSTYTFKVQAGETYRHLSEAITAEYTLQSK